MGNQKLQIEHRQHTDQKKKKDKQRSTEHYTENSKTQTVSDFQIRLSTLNTIYSRQLYADRSWNGNDICNHLCLFALIGLLHCLFFFD